MLPQQGLDGPGILCSAALFQRIAGGGTKGIQISGTDSGFLRSAVRVDAAAHPVIGRKGLRGGNAVVRHHHREPALRHRRQRLEKIAHTLHPAGAAHQGKGHIRTDLCAQRAQLTHGKVRTVQLVHAHQNSGSIGTAARHARPHRGIFIDCDVHPRQKAGVVKKGQRCLDGSVFVIGGHQTARQTQVHVGAAAQHHPLVQGDGLLSFAGARTVTQFSLAICSPPQMP